MHQRVEGLGHRLGDNQSLAGIEQVEGVGAAVFVGEFDDAPVERIALAAYFGEHGRLDLTGQVPVEATRAHCPDLARVADADELSVTALRQLRQRRGVRGRGGRGLVHHDHGAGGERRLSAPCLPLGAHQERDDRGGRHPGVAQLARGAAGGGDAEHRIAGLDPSLAGRGERGRLARARQRRHRDDPLAAGQEAAHHLRLLGAQVLVALQHSREGPLLDGGRSRVLSLPGDLDEALLQLPQALGRVVAGGERLGGAMDLDDPLAGEDRLRRFVQGKRAGALGQLVRQRAEHVAAVEVRAPSLEVVDRALAVGPLDHPRPASGAEVREPFDRRRGQPELLGAREPVGALIVGIDAVVLRVTSAVGGDFCRRGRAEAALGHRRDDLRPPLGEVLDHRPADSLDVGVAVSDRLPLQAELAGEGGAERGLVDVAGRFRVQPEGRAALRRGEAEPAPIGDGAGHVRGDDMGVKRRVPGARGAMAEGHRDEAGAGLDLLAAGSALHEAGVAVQVGEPLRDSVVVGAQGGGANLRRADRVEQGGRLRCGEAHVVAEDRLMAPLATRGVGEDARLGAAHEDFSGAGVPTGEHGGVVVVVDLAVQPQLGSQLADPLARRLARLRVVVLAAFGDGFDPVARVPAPDLRHSHHTSVVQRERLLHRPNCRVPSVSGCWGCGGGDGLEEPGGPPTSLTGFGVLPFLRASSW